jgi:aminodeoxyfutalosine synthase
MIAASPFDQYLERIAGGEDLEPIVVAELSASADILPAGMLADALKRRLHGTAVTFLRVAACPFDRSFADAVPPAAGEVRITGAPETLDIAVAAVVSARAMAGERAVTGFTWGDVERLTGAGGRVTGTLSRLREAGLDALAEVALDTLSDRSAALEQLRRSGFDRVRLHLHKPIAGDRAAFWLEVGDLQRRVGGIESINPLPLSLGAFKPTTGYEDVKAVAIARLAAPQVPHIQVDWVRYGPKLAQVALTFGASDLDRVSPFDDEALGRRRASVEEVRRNIAAAGFTPLERDALA